MNDYQCVDEKGNYIDYWELVNDNSELCKEIKQLQQENKQLKEEKEELKKWLEKEINSPLRMTTDTEVFCKIVLNKIKELEEGVN